MNMVDVLAENLIILLDSVHNIRTVAVNEINRFNEKSFYQKSDEDLMKFQSSTNIIESFQLRNDDKVNLISKNEENLCNLKKELILNSSRIVEKPDLLGMKRNDVLKSLKRKLEDSLSFVELLRQNVTERIVMVNNEGGQLDCKEHNETNSDSKDACLKISINENVESKNDDLKSNRTSSIFDKKEIENNTSVKCEFSESLDVTSNLSRHQKIFENKMISLISDDEDDDEDSDEDCIVCVDPIPGSTDVSNSDHPSDLFVPIKLESLSSFHINSTTHVTSNVVSERVADQQNDKSTKRKLDESEKHSKKKKKSRDKSLSLVNGTAATNMFEKFHKVKLSNLSTGITYAEIASLLQNSGLKFLDILLLDVGDKSSAEISFPDIEMKEKALSIDPPLFHAGMKIRIKPL